MALIKTELQARLRTRILTLEDQLKVALDSKIEGLYKAQENIQVKIKSALPTDSAEFTPAKQLDFQKFIWETTSDEWSNVLSKEIIKIVATDISRIIADEVDKYIKDAIIIIPAGQVITGNTTPSGTIVGATSAVSPIAEIS